MRREQTTAQNCRVEWMEKSRRRVALKHNAIEMKSVGSCDVKRNARIKIYLSFTKISHEYIKYIIRDSHVYETTICDCVWRLLRPTEHLKFIHLISQRFAVQPSSHFCSFVFFTCSNVRSSTLENYLLCKHSVVTWTLSLSGHSKLMSDDEGRYPI